MKKACVIIIRSSNDDKELKKIFSEITERFKGTDTKPIIIHDPGNEAEVHFDNV